MAELYPLCFTPIFKEKIWGGNKIARILNKHSPFPNRCGESWEISGVPENETPVANGPLKGKTLKELISKFQGRLVGEKVFGHQGTQFPLLIKFIDAAEDLSVQVHPDDAYAKRLGTNAKTEMWYVLSADPGATLVSGFKNKMEPEAFRERVLNGAIMEDLYQEPVQAGDFFYIPGRRIHTIGKGILLAEIQQSSDTTYRVYDFNRVDDQGNKRELHLEESIKVMDFDQVGSNRNPMGENGLLVESPYFKTFFRKVENRVNLALTDRDSFTILIALEGHCHIVWKDGELTLPYGNCLLIPASIKEVELIPEKACSYLECFVP